MTFFLFSIYKAILFYSADIVGQTSWCREMIRAVIFDLDGTLIYNHTNFMKMRRCVVEKLISEGIPEEILDRSDIIVNNMAQAEKYAKENNLNISKLYSAAGEIMSRVEMETVDLTTPVEGALDTIISLQNECYKTGILTRGSRQYAESALKAANLDIGFDVFICRDDYPEEEAKPAPIAMQRAAEAMRVEVSECLYLGDHAIDMKCAVSAGAQFLGVLTGAYTAEDWKKVGAEYIEKVTLLNSLLSLDQ